MRVCRTAPDGRPDADYAWVEDWEAYCVAFVEAAAPEMVLHRMVREDGTLVVSVPEAREWASAQMVPGGRSAIQARRVGGWVVTVEFNGSQATLPEVVRRISEGSRAIIVFRDIHAHTSFQYAIDGEVIRSFDPLVYDDPTPWDGPPLAEESGLDFGSGHPMAAAFALTERLTGLRLTPGLLEDTGGWVARGHYPFRSRPDSWDVEAANAHRQALRENPRLHT
ncbi:MAG: DUF6461 domain-containing protein, partial [Actinobacteria bacterium]|nr:DUF6461 domain-containing protein [Actinomycetota bacterium]